MDPVFGMAIAAAMALVVGRLLNRPQARGSGPTHPGVQTYTQHWDYVHNQRVIAPTGQPVCSPMRGCLLTARYHETMQSNAEIAEYHEQYEADRRVYFERVAAGLDPDTGLAPVIEVPRHIWQNDQDLQAVPEPVYVWQSTPSQREEEHAQSNAIDVTDVWPDAAEIARREKANWEDTPTAEPARQQVHVRRW